MDATEEEYQSMLDDIQKLKDQKVMGPRLSAKREKIQSDAKQALRK